MFEVGISKGGGGVLNSKGGVGHAHCAGDWHVRTPRVEVGGENHKTKSNGTPDSKGGGGRQKEKERKWALQGRSAAHGSRGGWVGNSPGILGGGIVQ
jgi:hypothetical protein